MILLHGGPGYSSFYLKPFEALADERPVVRYDQLGGGKSAAHLTPWDAPEESIRTVGAFFRAADSTSATR
ncbi:MAG: hypothetical protein ABIY46_03825 [Gemmatimonadales bacterium]